MWMIIEERASLAIWDRRSSFKKCFEIDPSFCEKCGSKLICKSLNGLKIAVILLFVTDEKAPCGFCKEIFSFYKEVREKRDYLEIK